MIRSKYCVNPLELSCLDIKLLIIVLPPDSHFIAEYCNVAKCSLSLPKYNGLQHCLEIIS